MFAPELALHLLVVLGCMGLMITAIVRFSQPTRPEFPLFANRLSQSHWLGVSRTFDDADYQYRGFRATLGTLFSLMVAHITLSAFVQKFAKAREGDSTYIPRALLSLSFSCIFLSVYIGVSGLIKLLVVLFGNYVVVSMLKGSAALPALAWIYGLAVLFATNYYNGFAFGSLTTYLAFLDNLGDGMSRWWIPLRFVLLKMISYDMDSYWRHTGKGMNEVNDTADPYCPIGRLEISHNEEDYDLFRYLTYILYVPLYIAGPILAFNDFISQLKRRVPATMDPKALALYTLRWVVCFALMEVFIHHAYVIAIAKSDAWKQFTAFEVACLCFFNLKHVWLKLLVMWRFFRMWALLDGIESVENMNRCMTNNYSASGFWRSWHRSFNRWIIRYIYVPLGGSNCYVINLLVTFTFVAAWHDLDLNLLAWGWLVSIFIIPETLALKAFPPKLWDSWPYYKHLCGIGAVANILLMIAVNIIGFGAIGGNGGIKGILETLPLIFNVHTLPTLLGIIVFFFSLSQCQFAYREYEATRGGDRRD
ncbi:MBOAT, membrane-bound O-acyltransferase family-domain-containing protein [Chytriomyces sp. MP71]|nr:MBOAT, membrane-bound O-acyltransferase family-domain-containing protein [Chytriomyces sp. MP71]